ncbi:ABC transporter ATP-binding protein [Phytoactinopolyspora limicola]|uniref:ABC transporter ATP-binding protein n=1 Tax=Phytoactinopolyspora limicola TaxID=2715536 RepID=UPI00140E634B|nr:ABC transporter ATP-binding protein [Phytoactinopolyspora limicola]
MSGSGLLEIRGLQVQFRAEPPATAVRNVSLDLRRGECVAVVGESGSGKSVTAMAVMGLLPAAPRTQVSGAIRFEGTDLLALDPARRRTMCGTRISMVFQDALAALNPVLTVGFQIAEMFRVHQGASRRSARRSALDLLARVGIPGPRERYGHYPHQFSGGMRQRLMIAIAVALEPDVLIADEPTTALDVTVQAQILQLLADLRSESGMALLLITHDLAVAAEVADRVAVMYAGRVVETGPVGDVLARPAHPYTDALLRSLPGEATAGGWLDTIPGMPPPIEQTPEGCAFHPRCGWTLERCHSERPELELVSIGRHSACHVREQVHHGG